MVPYSTEISGRKKRGRPAARSMQTAMSGVEKVQRARARTNKGSAKISEVESDGSEYTDEIKKAEMNEFKMLEKERSDGKKRGRPTKRSAQRGNAGVEPVRRTRARKVKGSAKIGEIESNSSDSTDEKTNAEEAVVDSKQKGKAIEQMDVADFKSNVELGKLPEVDAPGRYNRQDIGISEKLEVTSDPIQAMLLDMVPSLGKKETKSSSTVLEEKQPAVHNNSEPGKKKVSYKDVASELLKDW